MNTLIGLWDLLVRRSTPCTPRICRRCDHTTTRLSLAQRDEVLAGGDAVCGRRRCGGRLDLITNATEAAR
ncbi:hypothetical protein [Actinomadura bangladeshensis]|uniref:Uncharacterized protein n=1 Tax=Actinomadura bangladeshensis TaxID=453573 RepID=A0A6L9QAT5_9ACTN|nr:hypothetical protein [Actinomadura bangladeshensis]NEA21551.1 hypothetical protein [Actinomadura bangladeshensis]NEA22511.1 hypothetical protein [Actinomadura bangladeshensis]